MKNPAVVIACAVTMALAGCAATDDSWALKKSKPEAMQDCLEKARYWGPGTKGEIAGYMGVSEDRAPSLFCQRIVNALASGRITNKDIAKLNVSGSGKALQVIKGR